MLWIAGLPPVTFEETRNQKAQECALIQTSNPGVTHATAAARAVGGFLAVPKFPEVHP